jgi:hypothetical protein
MSVLFYDKEAIENDKICQRLDKIQQGYSKEAKYLENAGTFYADYDVKVQGRAANILKNESNMTGLGILVGTAVGVLALWEVIRGAGVLLKWVGDMLARPEEDELTLRGSRGHARDWNQK